MIIGIIALLLVRPSALLSDPGCSCYVLQFSLSAPQHREVIRVYGLPVAQRLLIISLLLFIIVFVVV